MRNKRRSQAVGRKRGDRKRRRPGSWRNLDVHYGPEAGEGVVQAPLEEVLAALDAHGDDLGWPSVSGIVLPVIPRVRPYPSSAPAPIQTIVAPGILVGFGIDIGPALLNVSPDLLESWRISTADLTAAAIANVHRRAGTVRPSAIHHGEIGDIATEWLQTDVSVGSTLVLAPTELQRLFRGPRFFITPMRDLIIGFPADAPREAAHWLYHEIAALDPNCLGPTGYAFDGERVVPEPLEVGGDRRVLDGRTASAFVA